MATQRETRNNAPLPDGIVIGGYRIVRNEDSLGTKFVIKEYLPNSLVTRASGRQAPMIPSRNVDSFRDGLKWLDPVIEAAPQPG